MKTTQIFLAILLLAVFTSCNKDDDDNLQVSNSVTWNLTNVAGGIAGTNETFPDGFIKWTFNGDNNMVTVENSNTDDMVATIFESGTYLYLRGNDGINDTLTINNEVFVITSETDTELKLSQVVVDGYLITLTR